jgi:hypothetical protein
MELAVVAMDSQEAIGIESRSNASIASGTVLASFNADAFSGDPGGVQGEVRGPRFEVQGEGAKFGIEREEDGGSERLATEALRAVLDASRERLAAEGGSDGVQFGRKGCVVDVDADSDDSVAECRGL